MVKKPFVPRPYNLVMFTAGIGLIILLLFHQTITDKVSLISGQQKKESWIVVFVHGTFNPGLGLLNIFNVLRDNLEGTDYAKTIKKMRKDAFYYQEQAMLERGLVRLTPSFEEHHGEHKLAAYPILSGYKMVLEALKPNQEEHFFYTYGWTGLMSQAQRRKEALRFYNALSEEASQFQQKGISPRIRLIAHSHGGNICLNLAAINQAKHLLPLEEKQQQQKCVTLCQNEFSADSLHEMVKIMSQAPSFEEAKKNRGQKRYDYLPSASYLSIDEFMAFGTPIQSETSEYFFSSTFKRTYNFYSPQDVIQRLDFISTKRLYSTQRISELEKITGDTSIMPHQTSAQVIQAKIMIGHKLIKKNHAEQPKSPPSFWEQFIKGSKIFTSESKDPTHKDLWFFAWNKEMTQPNFPFNPLPMVILAPLLAASTERIETHADLDLNICLNRNIIAVDVLAHRKTKPKHTTLFPLYIIETIKKHTLAWKPTNLSQETASKKIREKLI